MFSSGSKHNPVYIDDDDNDGDVVSIIDLTDDTDLQYPPPAVAAQETRISPKACNKESEQVDADRARALTPAEGGSEIHIGGLLSTLSKKRQLEEADAELARRLAEREELEYRSAVVPNIPNRKKIEQADAAIARGLAKQEEIEYARLVESIEAKEHGIVFSVVVNAADNTLEDGSPAHPDDIDRFALWRDLFERSGTKITKFHWFVNHELERRFNAARERLNRLGRSTNEVQLFHGTGAPNIDAILQSGLRIGGVDGHRVINGTAQGVGIYLAENADTAMGYASGSNRIFACRVLPGVITNNCANISRPPKKTLGEEPYDSYHGPFGGGNIYVVRNSDLVLPCYMIEFDNAAGQYGFGQFPVGMVVPPIIQPWAPPARFQRLPPIPGMPAPPLGLWGAPRPPLQVAVPMDPPGAAWYPPLLGVPPAGQVPPVPHAMDDLRRQAVIPMDLPDRRPYALLGPVPPLPNIARDAQVMDPIRRGKRKAADDAVEMAKRTKRSHL